MEKRKFIIGSILGLATMLVLSALSDFAGLDSFITLLFALLGLPFVFSALLVAAGTKPSEGVVFSIITQIMAIITIVLTVLDGYANLLLYIGTLALGFIAVMLLHVERTAFIRAHRRRKRIQQNATLHTSTITEIQNKPETKIIAIPEVPVRKARVQAKFVASENAIENIVHRSNCRIAKRIKSKNKIKFETYTEALEKGYVPCKICLKKEE